MMIAKGSGLSLGSDENVLKLTVVMVTELSEHTKNLEVYTLNG